MAPGVLRSPTINDTDEWLMPHCRSCVSLLASSDFSRAIAGINYTYPIRLSLLRQFVLSMAAE